MTFHSSWFNEYPFYSFLKLVVLTSLIFQYTDKSIGMAIILRIQQYFTFVMQWSCFGKRMAYQNMCNILKVKNTYIQLLHNSSSIQFTFLSHLLFSMHFIHKLKANVALHLCIFFGNTKLPHTNYNSFC